MSQSKCQIRLIRWTENPYRGSNCSLRVYMSEPNLKEVNGGGGGGVGWCWRERRGEGQLSPLMLRRHSDRWLTGLRASGSICGQQQQRWRGGEEHLIHFLFPPCDFFSIGAGRTKGGQLHDYRRQRAPSSRLQAGLAWCSIQPASLCGRALHASEDPLGNPGWEKASAFCLDKSGRLILRVWADSKQQPCQHSLRTQTADFQQGASPPGHTVTRRRLSALQPPAFDRSKKRLMSNILPR